MLTTQPAPAMASSRIAADRGEFPCAPDQFRFAAATWLMLADGQQSPGGNRNVGTLDLHQLRIAQHHRVADQPGRRFAQHHPARRGNGLHPLGHADLLTDGGVTRCARADFARDHLTGIQPDPQL